MGVAFLVDGVTEQRFVQMVCKDAVVQRINLNGASVQTTALAKRISSLIRLWGGRHKSIVVIVDLEKRTQSADLFATELLEALRGEGVATGVVVGVADRMIENWMIADPGLWPGMSIKENVDGCSGLTVLKKYTASHYDKAANGPELLKKSRASELKKRSPSFARLAEQLGHLRCHWLGR